MTPLLVTNHDNSGPGSLRDAIATANANPADDIIEFDPGVFNNPDLAINLSSGSLVIANNGGSLTIRGTDQTQVIIDGTATSRVIEVNNSSGLTPTIILDRLTIRNGSASGGGGGILNNAPGTLTLINSTVTSNTAGQSGGGIDNQNGFLNVINSTISGNMSSGTGGGLRTADGDIKNSTITGNTAGTAIAAANGGGVYSAASIDVSNSIIAGNFDGHRPDNTTVPGAANHPDVSSTFVDEGNNIIGDPLGSSDFTTSTTRLLNTLGLSASDVINTTLANNGGPTPTHLLALGSIAIDGAGSGAEPRGQRGVAIVGGRRDIGAVEVRTQEINVTGNSIAIATGDTTPDTADNTDFGAIAPGTSIVRTFTIGNTGELPLTLFGTPRVDVTGTNATDFTVTAVPSANINASSSDTFQIEFRPGSGGIRTATVTIENSDIDEGRFTFAIQGEGAGTATPTTPNAIPPAPPVLPAIAAPFLTPTETIRAFSSIAGQERFTVRNPNLTPISLGNISVSDPNIFRVTPSVATVEGGETFTLALQIADDVLPGAYATTVTIPNTIGPSLTFNATARVLLPLATDIAPIFEAKLPSNSPIWTGEDDVLIGAEIDGDGRQWLNGGPGNDQIFGNLDRDVITGGPGNDSLFGGQGDDWIKGAAGDDVIAGDFGDDTLIGGAGSDRFIIGPGRGSDEILDYSDGIDSFLLEPTLTFEQLTFEASGNSTQVRFGNEVLVTILGVGPTLLDGTDFVPLP